MNHIAQKLIDELDSMNVEIVSVYAHNGWSWRVYGKDAYDYATVRVFLDRHVIGYPIAVVYNFNMHKFDSATQAADFIAGLNLEFQG